MSTSFSTDAAKAIEHLRHELQSIRTGRANPALIEELQVEAYGTRTPLLQLAAISAPEPRLLVVQPWDPSTVKDIEKALTQSSLGISPVVDGKTIRLPFPNMTEERRTELTKVVNEKGEAAKVRIRTVREEVVKQLRQAEDQGGVSEDATAAAMKKLQTEVETAQQEIDSIVQQKHEELTIM